LSSFITKKNYSDVVDKLGIKNKLENAKIELSYLKSNNYMNDLVGTLGLDLLYKKL